jgi:hypothetical protein
MGGHDQVLPDSVPAGGMGGMGGMNGGWGMDQTQYYAQQGHLPHHGGHHAMM